LVVQVVEEVVTLLEVEEVMEDLDVEVVEVVLV
jgi:hypothetical protein